MRIWRSFRSRMRCLFKPSPVEEDLSAELQDYIEHQTQQYLARGLSPENARLAALRDLGGMEQVKEKCRDVSGIAWFETAVRDLRYGWRTMCANPLFTLMAVSSLALGIGANTAIYTLMDAILIRALPVRNPGELVIVNWRAKREPAVAQSHNGPNYDVPGGVESPDFPWPAYELIRDRNKVFSALFAYKDQGRVNLVVHGQAELGDVELVSGNFFSTLGVVPVAGRLLVDSDSLAGASHVAVISYEYWRDRFAGDPAVIGQTMSVNNIPFTITGVAPAAFFGVSQGSAPLVYVPISNRPELAQNYGNEHDTMFIDPHFYWVDMMGRLRPGVTLARAQAELSGLFNRFALDSAANQKERADIPALWLEEGGSGVDSLRRRYSKPLSVLMIMVAFILAITCANIANLLLSRAVARRREIAVRLSLGASRLRVIRQLLTESLMLAVAGGSLGVAVTAFGIRFLLWLLAGGEEGFTLHVEIEWRILIFTAALAFGTGILFGLAPAIQATRVDITPALKETRASAPRRRGHSVGLGQLLLVSQIALSLVLVLAAALFVRTLANLRSVEIGFNTENLLTFSLNASQAGYKDTAAKAFYALMDERFRALPGVRSATVTDMPLLANGTSSTGVSLPGVPKRRGRGGPSTSFISVGPAFFETIQLPVLLGRPIDRRDVDGSPFVAVINEVFAKRYFPNQNPIGRQFGLNSDSPNVTIVGIAKNARYSSLKSAIPPVTYISYRQNIFKFPPGAIYFLLRTAGDLHMLAESVRKTVHEVAPSVPVTDMKTQSQQIDSTIAQERTFAHLCTAFAVLALAIACVGLYGTTSYAISRRTNEIGIRKALGAEPRRIIGMVLREVLVLAAAGLAIGLIGAWSATFTIRAFLFGVKPADPLTMLFATGILLAALVLAASAPALRASRIDPLAALRHE